MLEDWNISGMKYLIRAIMGMKTDEQYATVNGEQLELKNDTKLRAYEM